MTARGSIAGKGMAAGASLALHLAAGLLVAWIGAPDRAQPGGSEALTIDFDLDEAPAPPQAHVPAADDAVGVPVAVDEPEEPSRVADEVPQIVERPEPVPEPAEESAAGATLEEPAAGDDLVAGHDAGPHDAAVAIGPDAGHDAGPHDAEAVAARDADAGPGDARAVAATGASEAGADAETANPPGAPAMTAEDSIPAAREAGDPRAPDSPDDNSAGDSAADVRAGAAAAATAARTPADANLLGYLPPGNVLAVLLRLDRLRGTEWAAQAEAILAPMPDYRGIIGGRKVSIGSVFDTFVIASPDPRDAAVTTLVGRARAAPAVVRRFLDRPGARVRWRPARGGALGVRVRTPDMQPDDHRVFLIPAPEWVTLARRPDLGALTLPAQVALDDAVASPRELPPWLTRVTRIEAESGQRAGPAMIVTIAGMLPDRYEFPYIGELPIPARLTLALEIGDRGFLIRGAMVFASPAQAEAFAVAAQAAQARLTGSRLSRALLSRAHAYHALRGLSLVRRGARVGYATSISTADARAMMALAADSTRAFYDALRAQPASRARPAPAAGKPTPAAGKPTPAVPDKPAPAAPAPAVPDKPAPAAPAPAVPDKPTPAAPAPAVPDKPAPAATPAPASDR